MRRSAAEALGEIGSEKAVESLIHAFKDTDYFVRSTVVRSTAAEVLGEIGNEKAVESLILFFINAHYHMNADYHIQRTVAEALGKIAESNCDLPTLTQQLPHLRNLISTESSQLALSVITAIQSLCKYYNYDIAQTSLPPEDKSRPLTGTTNIFNAPVGQVVGRNLIVQGDNIATQLVSRVFRHWLNLILEYLRSNGSRK